jgi:hypothetical protein
MYQGYKGMGFMSVGSDITTLDSSLWYGSDGMTPVASDYPSMTNLNYPYVDLASYGGGVSASRGSLLPPSSNPFNNQWAADLTKLIKDNSGLLLIGGAALVLILATKRR